MVFSDTSPKPPSFAGFFHNTPVDNLYGYFLFAEYFMYKYGAKTKEFVIVAPDAGAVEKARNLADKLSASHVVTILKVCFVRR